MSRVWAAAFLLRRLRDEVGVALMIFALVAVTAFLFAAAPRLFNQMSDVGLRHRLEAARVVQRNLQISILGPGQPADALAGLADQGQEFLAEMPQSLRSLVVERAVSVTSPRFIVTDAPDRTYQNTFISLRYQDGLGRVTRLVAGRMPGAHGAPLPPIDYGFTPGDPEPPEVLPRFDIALSDATAEAAGLQLGEVIEVTADGNDPMLDRRFAIPLPAEFEVVGIFSVVDADAGVWYDDSSLQVLDLAGSDDNPIALVTALVHPDAYVDVAASGLPFLHEWRYFVDPGRVTSDQAETLVADMRRMQSRFLTSATALPSTVQPTLRTALPELLDGYVAERSASEAVLSVAVVGPLVLAAGAVGMVGVLLVARRRAALALARGRGASGLLLIGAQLWEALLMAGLAGAAGWFAATLLVPGRAEAWSALLALVVVLSAVAALVAATWPVARRPLGDLADDARPLLRPSPRRLVLEGTAVVLCAGGVLLLRQRGLAIDDGEATRFDPMLAATPALAGLAVGIVAMRLYPLPIRALAWLAARRRDLVPVLGLRTVGRHPAHANLPLLVLMLTAAFGAFSSVVTATVDRGQLVASWENLGADYRISRIGGGSVSRADPTGLPGIEAVAGAYVDPAADFTSTPNQSSAILLYGLDADAYRDVTRGAPISAALPADLVSGARPTGTPESPIPAVLSRRLPPASQPVPRGGTFQVIVAGQSMTFVNVQDRLEFPGLEPDAAFVIASLDQLQAAYTNQTLEPNQFLVRAPAEVEAELRAHLQERVALGQLASRHAAYRDLQQAPLVAAVVIGFRGALVVAAAYTALATMAALTLSASARTRDLAFLRILGVSARQALQLTVVEHGPPVLIALAPGVALGVAVAVLLAPSLGLAAFAGTERALAVTVDWIGVALMSVALLVVVAVAIGAATWLARRARAADALRIGDD
ncbi:MAG TPA: FtsX-like permease family protein [Candidatus Limnocylindria bacterium]|nr:FtsX-like permease family protein [Candidatus Limnocylindria bacterium]